jgi:HEAT repeat protein
VALALLTFSADRWRDGREAPRPSIDPAPSGRSFDTEPSWSEWLLGWLPGSDERALEPLRDFVHLARDPKASLELRVGAARWIARDGGAAGLEILTELLEGDAPPALRAAVAEALGESKAPDARGLLEALLESEDEAVARGALRGVAAGPGAVGILEMILLDEARPLAVRSEAAASLGALEREESAAVLRAALAELDDEALVASVLGALGEHPFPRNADAFHAVLANPALPRQLKLEALEALGDSSTDAAALLLDYAARAPEPELRAAAVEAIAFLDDSRPIAPWLLRLVESEPAPAVRAEIYGALAFHARATYAATDVPRFLDVILSETGGPARLQGFRLVASIVRVERDARLAEAFDSRMAPWLVDEALRAGARAERLACLDALKLAGTPGATQALVRLSGSPDATLADAAAKALRSGTPRHELSAN